MIKRRWGVDDFSSPAQPVRRLGRDVSDRSGGGCGPFGNRRIWGRGGRAARLAPAATSVPRARAARWQLGYDRRVGQRRLRRRSGGRAAGSGTGGSGGAGGRSRLRAGSPGRAAAPARAASRARAVARAPAAARVLGRWQAGAGGPRRFGGASGAGGAAGRGGAGGRGRRRHRWRLGQRGRDGSAGARERHRRDATDQRLLRSQVARFRRRHRHRQDAPEPHLDTSGLLRRLDGSLRGRRRAPGEIRRAMRSLGREPQLGTQRRHLHPQRRQPMRWSDLPRPLRHPGRAVAHTRHQDDIDTVVASPVVNDWTWVDAIQMAMPVYAGSACSMGGRPTSTRCTRCTRTRRRSRAARVSTTRPIISGGAIRFRSRPTPSRTERTATGRGATAGFTPRWCACSTFFPATDPHRAEYLADFEAMSDGTARAAAHRRVLEREPVRSHALRRQRADGHRALHVRDGVGRSKGILPGGGLRASWSPRLGTQ